MRNHVGGEVVYRIPDNCNASNFSVVWCRNVGGGHSYPPPAFTGRGGLSHPARFFATLCNFSSDFVSLSQTRILVQRRLWCKRQF
jgi:hypothetical protein